MPMNNLGNLVFAFVLVASISCAGIAAYVAHDGVTKENANFLMTFQSYGDLSEFLKNGKESGSDQWDNLPYSLNTTERPIGYGEAPFSHTNVQVAGVDEEDTVKTDGTYMYISSYTRISIVQAYPPSKMRNVSVIEAKDVLGEEHENVSTNIQGLYVSNNKLVILVTVYDCFYQYDSAYLNGSGPVTSFGPRSFVVTYDVSDPSEPKLVSVFGVSGWELTSRMIGNVVVLVANSYTWSYGTEPILPLTWVGNEHNELGIDRIFYDPETREASGFVNIFAVDLESGDHDWVSVVCGFASTIYMSSNSLYLTVVKWNGPLTQTEIGVAAEQTDTAKTTIYRITIDGVNMAANARGDVSGWLLNQFSLDEKDPYLRVATTSDLTNSKNNVYVLDSELAVIGALEGLAPGERICSSRFIGDTLYVVTFRQTDPLFVIDLRNPTSPSVLGSLKMPGFSNYLQAIDNTHLLGIGSENNSVKISLYDVTNPAKPKEISKYLVAGCSYSNAQWDHKAVLFDRQQGLLVIPVSSYIYGCNGSEIKRGAFVFSVSIASGVALRGIIVHSSSDSWCWNPAVLRSLFLSAHLYTISGSQLKVNNINDLSEEGTLTYYVPPWIYPVPVNCNSTGAA
jgi:uncharacterized secreted protein with C-terminal beta-propeller domain